MPLAVVDCVDSKSIGESAAAMAAAMTLCGSIKTSIAGDYRVCCTTTLVRSSEQAADEMFDYSKALAVIGPVFPFVWVQVRYDPDTVGREAVQAKLTSLGLLEIAFTISKRHTFVF